MSVGGDLTSIPGLFLPFGRGWPVDEGRTLNATSEWQQIAYGYRDVIASDSTVAPPVAQGGRGVKFPRTHGPRKFGPRR